MSDPTNPVGPEAASANATTRNQRRNPALGGISVVRAGFLFAASVAVGAWLVTSAPDVASGSSADNLTSQSSAASYGGDAYTGIQNAAAETENAVVAGFNSANKLANDIQDAQAESQHTQWGHLWKGLAALIVLLGAGNFIASLQRYGAARSMLE